MLPDYHIHTPLCKHAEGPLEALREAACERRVPEMAFTDHAPAPDGYDPENRMMLDEFPDYRRMVYDLAAGEGSVPVLFGIEADYQTRGLAFLKTWLPAQPFDLVLGSVHFLDTWGFDNPKERRVWDSVDVPGAWRAYFRLLGLLADMRLFDVIAHLDLPKKFGHRPSDPALKEMAQPALDRIAAAGMAIEINTSGLRRPVKEIYPSPLLLDLAREREIPICFGSDCHRPAEIAFAFDQALALARDVGYTRAVRFHARQKVFYALPV